MSFGQPLRGGGVPRSEGAEERSTEGREKRRREGGKEGRREGRKEGRREGRRKGKWVGEAGECPEFENQEYGKPELASRRGGE
jgi:hypothetical protein